MPGDLVRHALNHAEELQIALHLCVLEDIQEDELDDPAAPTSAIDDGQMRLRLFQIVQILTNHCCPALAIPGHGIAGGKQRMTVLGVKCLCKEDAFQISQRGAGGKDGCIQLKAGPEIAQRRLYLRMPADLVPSLAQCDPVPESEDDPNK